MDHRQITLHQLNYLWLPVAVVAPQILAIVEVHQAVAVLADLIYDASYSLSASTSYSVTVGEGGAGGATNPSNGSKVKTLSLMIRQPSAVVTVVKETIVIQSNGGTGGSGGGGGQCMAAFRW
jgi:hypothetical protein